MNSEQRKYAIQGLLKRGQLKQLATDLNMSYSYLSQAFSTTTAINFTAELARKVEQALGLYEGQLDQSECVGVRKINPLGLFVVALIGREAQLSSFFPEKRVVKNDTITFDGEDKDIDLVVYNEDDSIYLLAEQSQHYDAFGAADQLIMLMAVSGAEYGVVFAPDSGVNLDSGDNSFSRDQTKSRWYKSVEGKVIRIAEGPNSIFYKIGI